MTRKPSDGTRPDDIYNLYVNYTENKLSEETGFYMNTLLGRRRGANDAFGI